MSISRRDICTRTYQVHWGGKSIKTTHKKKQKPPNTTTRKSPSQTCVSPEETAKQTAKHQNNTKNGPEPKQNTHKIDLPWDAVACPLHHYQKRANELGITAFNYEKKITKNVRMSRSATPARNGSNETFETSKKHPCCRTYHRHGPFCERLRTVANSLRS